MPEMPIPQEYNRFIEGQESVDEENNLEGDDSVYNMFDQESEVEELEDGSAIVRLEDLKGPEDNPNFYENLADKIEGF